MEDQRAVLLAHGPITPPAAEKPAVARVDLLLPWLLGIGTSLPFSLFTDGAERWLALGIAAGLAVGAGLAWHTQRRTAAEASATIDRLQQDFRADADGRVAMVVRQFQWAVNDVASLQDTLAKTKDLARAAEQRARRAEGQIRLLELEVARAKGRAVPHAGEPGIAPNAAHPDDNVFVTRDGELVRH